MEDTLVSFEVAKLAKEKGFKEKCTHYFLLNYSNFIADGKARQFKTPIEDDKTILNLRGISKGQPHMALAPTQSLLQKWLREIHKIAIDVNTHYNTKEDILSYVVVGFKMEKNCYGIKFSTPEYSSYEKALEQGLLEALKLI